MQNEGQISPQWHRLNGDDLASHEDVNQETPGVFGCRTELQCDELDLWDTSVHISTQVLLCFWLTTDLPPFLFISTLKLDAGSFQLEICTSNFPVSSHFSALMPFSA